MRYEEVLREVAGFVALSVLAVLALWGWALFLA